MHALGSWKKNTCVQKVSFECVNLKVLTRGLSDPSPPAYRGEETLEDFNVRVLFDKLEDQNLHLASQLARHQQDMQAFYSRMVAQNDELKDMVANLDADALQAASDRPLSATDVTLAGMGGAAGSGMLGAGATAVNAQFGLGNLHRQLKFMGEEPVYFFCVDRLLIRPNKIN